MLHFGMNMPYYLMMIYGSMMIVMVLILRGLFKNRLPKFVFPMLWVAVLLRFVIPFSVSSPLSLRLPWNILSPIQISQSTSVDTVSTAYGSSEAAEGTGITVTTAEDSPVVNYVAGNEWQGQMVGYDNVSIAYDPVDEKISVKGGSATEMTEAYGGITQEASSGYYPSYGSVFDGRFFDLFYKDIFMIQKLLLAVYLLGFIVVAEYWDCRNTGI